MCVCMWCYSVCTWLFKLEMLLTVLTNSCEYENTHSWYNIAPNLMWLMSLQLYLVSSEDGKAHLSHKIAHQIKPGGQMLLPPL